MQYILSKKVVLNNICNVEFTSSSEFNYALKRNVQVKQIQDVPFHLIIDEIIAANMFADFINFKGTIQCGPIKRVGDVNIDPETFTPCVTLMVEFNLIQG